MDDTLEKQAYVIYDILEDRYRSSKTSGSYSKKFSKAIMYTHRHIANQAAKEHDVVVAVNVKIDLTELMIHKLKGK